MLSKTQVNLVSHLLDGLQSDCRSFYPDENTAIEKFFMAVKYLSASADGCLELSLAGKAVETSLITGEPLHLPFGIFNTKSAGTALPQCGYFLFSRIFHMATCTPLYKYLPSNGCFSMLEREDTNTETSYTSSLPLEELNSYGLAVFVLRQVLLIHSKRRDLPTIAVEDEEVASFIDRVLVKRDITLPRAVVRTAREYLRRLFLNEDGTCLAASLEQWLANPFGRHGPGAVFDCEVGKEKWNFCDSHNAWITHPEFVDPTSEKSISKCRLSIVPKDFRKHRIICIEQKETMFYQQGLRAVMEFLVHSNPLSRRSVSLDDQSLNFNLSKRLDFCTIDLKDASDLVSRRLCKLLFPTEVYKLLVNGRATKIVVPSGDEYSYESMFTMGNALCFTTETIVFASLVAAAISCFSGKSLEKSSRLFRVFGDDICVHHLYHDVVLQTLRQAGFEINQQKTCCNTLVRESCGSWYVGRLDVRITRPATMQIVNDIDWIAWFQVICNLANTGLNSTAAALADSLSAYYPVPKGYFGIPGDRKITRMLKDASGRHVWRWNPQLQREEFLLPSFRSERMEILGGRKQLYAYFTRQATKFVSTQKTSRDWTLLE